MDKLAAMRAFVEICEQGSLTAAAEALGKSQPTMAPTDSPTKIPTKSPTGVPTPMATDDTPPGSEEPSCEEKCCIPNVPVRGRFLQDNACATGTCSTFDEVCRLISTATVCEDDSNACCFGGKVGAVDIGAVCEEIGGTVCAAKSGGGGACGDPHFETWTGEWYDYHGVCDLVLFSVPSFAGGLGLDVHIRTSGRDQFSFIETAAVRIGEDVLEMGSYGEWFLNGVEEAELPAKMGGKYPVSYHSHHAGDHVIEFRSCQSSLEFEM